MDSIWINGKNFQLEDFIKAPAKIQHLRSFEQAILFFVVDWISGKKEFDLKTSGSTGDPKIITIHRNYMIASAEMTLTYLKINKGGIALLCLNPEYIAGIMMIVRSLVGGLDLYAVTPVSNPLLADDLDYAFDLAAFVPYQVTDILSHKKSASNMHKIRHVLIGGADLPNNMVTKLNSFDNPIYQTFGMTETVSHIAIKRLSGENLSGAYEVLEGIITGTDDRGCLTVSGAVTGGKKIITNDLVEFIDDKSFLWKGRIDRVINTGGVKININDLERKITRILHSNDISHDFFISCLPDPKLGEKVILLVEDWAAEIDIEHIKKICEKGLMKYELPKEIFTLRNFLFTETGKINRPATLRLLTDEKM